MCATAFPITCAVLESVRSASVCVHCEADTPAPLHFSTSNARRGGLGVHAADMHTGCDSFGQWQEILCSMRLGRGFV